MVISRVPGSVLLRFLVCIPGILPCPSKTGFGDQVLLLGVGLAMLLVSPIATHAEFTFLTNNGALTITGYTGPGGDVLIPDTVYGLPVTSIADSAFQSTTSITNIVVPNTVSNIGNFAFYQCANLTGAVIPDSVISVGEWAFGYCVGLTSFAIPQNVAKIANGTFARCSSLRGCKNLSVNCSSSIRLHPSGVRRSGGERSEPQRSRTPEGWSCARAKNWSRAGHLGFLLGCQQTHPTQNTKWPTNPSLNS